MGFYAAYLLSWATIGLALGYARLNKLLNPDICVLEGGYSIEGALPYTNLGIILAMAGMDFSQVREPDYDPSRFTQPPEMNKYIESLCAKALAVFAGRGGHQREAQQRRIVTNQKNIFYDTTGFHVQEKTGYHLCPHCPGFSEVKASGNRRHIHAFTVPFNSCRRCQDEARDLFAKSKPEAGTIIALQDRIADIYETK